MKHLFHILILLIFTNCTNLAGGGGADIGNPIMTGIAFTSAHERAAGVEIYLLPSDYMADSNEIAPQYRTVTDKDGNYSFAVDKGVSYTLSANTEYDNRNYSLFRRGICPEDTTVFYDTLEKSVNLVLRIPQNSVDVNTTLSMPGIPKTLSYEQVSFQDELVWKIENLPQGDIAEIFMKDLSGNHEQLTDSLVLGSDSVQVIDTYIEWSAFTKENSPLAQDSVYEVYRDSRGVHWFGTYGGGIYRGDTWQQFSTDEGLPNPVVLAIEEDQNGTIWCGTSSGVALINGSSITPLTSVEAPVNSTVFDIFRDNMIRLWFGTGDGLYLCDQGAWTHFTPDNSGLPHNIVYSITWNEDRLYVGTFGGGIATFDLSTWDTITQENSGLSGNYIYVIDFDKSGQLWCATSEGLSLKSGNSWSNINTGNSALPDNTIWSMAVDGNGTVWAGTEKGTVQYKNGHMKIFREDNSRFNSPFCFSIYVDSTTESVLFGTTAGAVIRESF